MAFALKWLTTKLNSMIYSAKSIKGINFPFRRGKKQRLENMCSFLIGRFANSSEFEFEFESEYESESESMPYSKIC